MTRIDRIKTTLAALDVSHIEVTDQSAEHGAMAHASDANNAASAQTHLQLLLVCASFAELSQVQRHQQVYQLLNSELQNGLHALSLHTYSLEEWQAQLSPSPGLSPDLSPNLPPILPKPPPCANS